MILNSDISPHLPKLDKWVAGPKGGGLGVSVQGGRTPTPCRDGDHGRFETRVRDGYARLGLLHTERHILRTPTLLPVVNPNILTISPKEMWDMGFEALITNSYIIWKSEQLRSHALEHGVHHLLDYAGVVMTDSGVFQQYVYGDVEVGETEVVEFQRDIGVDIATMMDVFGRPDMSREELEDAVRVTAERGPAALAASGDTLMNGPVQGGTYADLRAESARLMSGMDFAVHPIGGIVPLMERQRYRELVEIIVASKSELTSGRPVHAFGCGHPLLFPICVALGIDLFDSAAYALFAKDDRLLTPVGTVKLQSLEEWPHSSPALMGTTPAEVRQLPVGEKIELLARHNLQVTEAELARCREAVREGTIWNLVEERSHCNPHLREATLWLYENMPERIILNSPPCRKGGIWWSDDTPLHPRMTNAAAWLHWVPPLVTHMGEAISVDERVLLILHNDEGPWRETLSELVQRVVSRWPSVTPLIYTPIGLTPYQLEDLNPYSHILGPSILWDAIAPFREEEEIESFIFNLINRLLGDSGSTALLHNAKMDEGDLLLRLTDLLGEGLPEDERVRSEVVDHFRRFGIADKISLFTGISCEATHSIASKLEFVMSRTGRVNNILHEGLHLFSQRLGDGGLSLTDEGAKWVHRMMDEDSGIGLPWVVIDSDAEPYVRDGRNVMHGFIERVEGILRYGMPTLVVNGAGELVGHGISMSENADAHSFKKGIAVKVRGGISS